MDHYHANIAVDASGAESALTVAGRLTIEHAADIKESLVTALDSAASLVLDLSGVAQIDVIGLQLVCALHRSANAQGKGLQVRGTGNAAVEAARKAAGFQSMARCSRELGTSCVWSDTEEGGVVR